MNPQRPLAGCVVGISISESEDLAGRHYDSHEVNRCVALLAETLLGNGARLAFGHDWRPNGVMMAVADFAVRYAPSSPRSPGAMPAGEAPILNLVAPPDRPFLHSGGDDDPVGQRLRGMLAGVVTARTIEFSPRTDDRRVARADSLSALRVELTRQCHARICLGGRVGGFAGWFPGVAEEAHLALRSGQPLFTSAIFGGAAGAIATALVRRGPPPVWEPHAIIADTPLPPNLDFRDLRPAPNGLTPAEQTRLFDPPSPEACIELILRGLVQWWRRR